MGMQSLLKFFLSFLKNKFILNNYILKIYKQKANRDLTILIMEGRDVNDTVCDSQSMRRQKTSLIINNNV